MYLLHSIIVYNYDKAEICHVIYNRNYYKIKIYIVLKCATDIISDISYYVTDIMNNTTFLILYDY